MLFVFIVGILFARVEPAHGALVSGTYQINWDQNVERTGTETKDERKFKQTLELKYKGFMSPVVENEMTFKIEQEINSNAADITRFLPTLDLDFKAKYWEGKSGAKRTHENSDEPGKNPRISDGYFVEFYYQPPKSVPDVKAKYSIDTDFEEGTADTRKDSVLLSSVYSPVTALNMKGEYNRTTNDDRFKRDNDTEEEKANGTLAYKHMFTEKVKLDLEYLVEITRGATLFDNGAATNVKSDQKQTAKSLLSFRPFKDTSATGSYDVDVKQNMINGEHTLTNTARVTAAQKIGNPFDVRGEFSRITTETRHTVDDYTKTEDTLTVDVKAKFSKMLDFIMKRQNKHVVEDHLNVSKSLTNSLVNDTATWTGEMTPFWKASFSYDRTDTFGWVIPPGVEKKTTVDTKYGLKSTFDFPDIRLTIDPTYDIVTKDDLVAEKFTATRDFKFKFVYTALVTRTLEAKVDHTYGRKTDSGAGNIQRTDTSTGNVTIKDPVPGWTFAIDVTRNATDTSGDDLPPDINATFGFKADYKRNWLSLNTSYKYDKKSLTDSSETFDAKGGWVARDWEISLTYSFTKVFSETLNEKSKINLTFKYVF